MGGRMYLGNELVTPVIVQGDANIEQISITPTTSEQTIIASGGVDGYSPISVSAVTSSIDANITAGNIKSGVSILGIAGSLTPLNGTTVSVTPSTSSQSLSPSSPYNGYTSVSVSAVDSSIDANIQASNIKSGVSILGVTGTYSGGGYSELPSYKASSGVASRRSGTLTGHEFDGVTILDANAFNYMFYNCSNLSGDVNLSDLITVNDRSLYSAFFNCSSITSVDLSSLVTLNGQWCLGNAFYNCSSITSVDLSSLVVVSSDNAIRSCFQGCYQLSSIDISSLDDLSGSGCLMSAFSVCSNLESISFTSLSKISGSQALYSAFSSCTKLKNMYFPSIKSTSFGTNINQFQLMLTGTNGATIHFPSNLSSTIAGLTGYPTFSGSNVTLAFDLPSTS